ESVLQGFRAFSPWAMVRAEPYPPIDSGPNLQMPHADLAATIEAAFETRDTVNYQTSGEIREAVVEALSLLDSGQARVAQRAADGSWQVNQWLKKAVLLS